MTTLTKYVARIRSAVRAYATGVATVDPAVALGLFGTGVGMAIPLTPPPGPDVSWVLLP